MCGDTVIITPSRTFPWSSPVHISWFQRLAAALNHCGCSYPQVPGDGRELVVTDPAAVKIRAEDGRRVEAVDISPFIGRLPGGRCTNSFRTDDASGSTSQAANIQVRQSLLLVSAQRESVSHRCGGVSARLQSASRPLLMPVCFWLLNNACCYLR